MRFFLKFSFLSFFLIGSSNLHAQFSHFIGLSSVIGKQQLYFYNNYTTNNNPYYSQELIYTKGVGVCYYPKYIFGKNSEKKLKFSLGTPLNGGLLYYNVGMFIDANFGNFVHDKAYESDEDNTISGFIGVGINKYVGAGEGLSKSAIEASKIPSNYPIIQLLNDEYVNKNDFEFPFRNIGISMHGGLRFNKFSKVMGINLFASYPIITGNGTLAGISIVTYL